MEQMQQLVVELYDKYKRDNCTLCGKEGFHNQFKVCGKCFNVKYCSKNCQILHWPAHKNYCYDKRKLQENYEKATELYNKCVDEGAKGLFNPTEWIDNEYIFRDTREKIKSINTRKIPTEYDSIIEYLNFMYNSFPIGITNKMLK